MAVDTYISGFFLVLATALLGVLGLVTVRRLVNSKILEASHDVGGHLFPLVGTMYAVVLGLIVVDSMRKFQEAHQATEQEVSAVGQMVVLSNRFPETDRQRIQRLAARYATIVMEQEWPAMDAGTHSPAARRAAIELIDAVCAFQPQTDTERLIQGALVQAVGQFWNARRLRISIASHGIPGLEWTILFVGGIVTMSFTYIFVAKDIRLQVIMVAFASIVIALNVFLVEMFGNPFSGDLRIDRNSFKNVTEIARQLQLKSRSSPAAVRALPTARDSGESR